MLVIGITGPTGAGKTTALLELEARGFEVVDCDRLYHQLLRTDGQLRRRLTDAFGEVFGADGQLDRRALAARVFGDKGELEKLDRIVFPAVYAAVEQKIVNCRRKGLVIDAINLIESGMGKLCGLTIAVTAAPAVRVKRIMQRDGLSEAQALARVNAQKPDKFYRKHCTFLLENRAGSKAEFQSLIGEFLDDIIMED